MGTCMNSRFTRAILLCVCLGTASVWAQTSPDLDQLKARMTQLQQMMEELQAQMAAAEKAQPPAANAPAPAASKAPGARATPEQPSQAPAGATAEQVNSEPAPNP